jgi:predicted HTH transcriptional regulator
VEDLSVGDLLSRLRNTEDNFVERKSANDVRDCLPTAVGFANSLPLGVPGVIFLPVRNDGRIEPMPAEGLDAFQKKVTAKINEAYPPIAFVSKILRTESDEQLLAVIVPGSADRPHFAGPSYVRVGPETKKASERQFESLVDARQSITREILKWKGRTVTFASLADAASSRVTGPIRGIQDVIVDDCNQFYVTLRTTTGNLLSFPLKRVALSFDNSNQRLQLEVSPT